MKKLFVVGAAMIFVSANRVNAQYVTMTDVLVSSVKLNEGPNSVPLPGNTKFQFDYRAGTFSNIIFLDSLNIAHPLAASRGTVNGAPEPSCGANQVKETYASSTRTVGAAICKPRPSSTGAVVSEYKLVIDMPGPGATGKALNRRVEVKLSK